MDLHNVTFRVIAAIRGILLKAFSFAAVADIAERARSKGAEVALPRDARVAKRIVSMPREINHAREELKRREEVVRAPVVRAAPPVNRRRNRIMLEDEDRLVWTEFRDVFELRLEPSFSV